MRPPPFILFRPFSCMVCFENTPLPFEKKTNPGEGLMDNGYGKRCDGRILHTLEDLRYTPRASTKTQTTRVSDTRSVNCVMCTDMAHNCPRFNT